MSRRRTMLMNGQEVEEMEYLVKEKLYEYTLPQGNVEKTLILA